MKKHFKVEGSLKLQEAVLQFREKKVRKVSGTILVSAIISLCKGDDMVKLHEIKKEIEVA
jgi:divalent metal cation (Fe/Co/Zn/Cd) transporter